MSDHPSTSRPLRDVRLSHRAMTLIVVLMAAASLLAGERVQAGGGLGWDGVTYAKLVLTMDRLIAADGLDTYYAQRLLPAALIRGMLLALRQPLTNTSVIQAFALYNAVLAVGSTLVWRRIADRLDFGLGARWIGFSALFVTWAFAKQNFFYPVLTDMTAYLLGMLMLLFSIEKKRWALLGVTVAAAFCWPVAALSGAVLLLLLHTTGDRIWVASSGLRLRGGRARAAVVAALAAAAVLLVAIALTASGAACPLVDAGFGMLVAELPAGVGARLPGARACAGVAKLLTAVPTLFLFGAAVAWLALSGLRVRAAAREARRIRSLDILAAALGILIPMIGIKLLSNPALPTVSSPFLLARLVLFPSGGMILMPLVSLAVFWGPAVLLLLFRWRAVTVAARRLGPGVVSVLCLNLAFGAVGEPRFITLAWPFLVASAVKMLNDDKVSKVFGLGFAILSLSFAQFWLPLNYETWDTSDYSNLLILPKQLYFMHYGLWMSWAGYVAQMAALLASGFWMWWVLRRDTKMRIRQ